MTAPNKTAQQLYQQFCDAYNSRDLSKALSLFTKQASMIGTAADETRVGLQGIEDQLKRDWGQSQAGEIRVTSYLPSSESASWACALCEATITVDGQTHHIANIRGSISIENEDGTWKIAHMHGSFPDAHTPEGSSFPIKN